MLVPIFSLQFNTKVFPQTLAVGKFDGKKPCLVGATVGNKIFIHSRNETNSNVQQLDGNISFLNINQVVTSLVCGQLDEDLKKDLLVVGTSTNIIAYDIERNVDLFYKENPDGAHAMTIGRWGELPEQLAIAGGNCSIHGINKKSEDVLWTVTGDNVSSLALLDFNSDGYNELIVASEDYDIRVFREDKLISEIQESETVVSICPLNNAKFGYTLSNGTIGIYERTNRLWRIKSRNIGVVLQAFDVNGDGVDELVVGWSNGRIDVRNERTGEIIFKDNLKSSVVGIVKSDYRISGENSLICCSNDGEVRGYKFSVQDTNAAAANVHKDRQEAVRELTERRQALLVELENFDNMIKKSNSTDNQSSSSTLNIKAEIPANTEIQTMMNVEKSQNGFPAHIAIRFATLNQTIIRVVSIYAEGLFRGECFVAHPSLNQVCDNIIVPIIPERDISIDLHFQILVGLKTSTLYHVFELSRPLPMFSMYMIIENSPEDEPKGVVTFTLNERISRILLWINQNFLFTEEYVPNSINLYVTFLCVRTDMKLVIKMQNNGQIKIQTDDMEIAGNIIQSMGKFLKIEDLQTVCDFPQEFELLQHVFYQIEQYQNMRQKISSDMGEHANVIRTFLIRAEDSRLIGDISIMKQY